MKQNPIETSRPTRSPRAQAAGRSRRWLPPVGAAGLAVLIAFGLWPRPQPVELAQVKQGELRVTVNEEGKTRIKQRFLVACPVTGQLRRIELKPGAEIRLNETVLAVIDPLRPAMLDARSRAQAEAKRDAARANLEKAKATHTFAVSELRRFEKLYAESALSIQELEPVQWKESSAARDQAAAESALRQAEADLAEFAPSSEAAALVCRTPTEIKAPATGRVLRVFEESSRVVAAGAALLEIGNPADLEAVVEVLSRDGAAIVAGMKVELEQWGGGPPLSGRVRLVEPSAFTKVSALGVEEQRVNVVADILTPVEQRPTLGDNFRVEARIVIWEAERTLKVPAGALFRRGNQWAALVMKNGRAMFREVKVGRTSGSETQILEGLNDGEEVILYPGDHVHAGDRVRPIKI